MLHAPRPQARRIGLACGLVYLLLLHAVVVTLVVKTNFLLLAGKTIGLIPPEEWSVALMRRMLDQADLDRATEPDRVLLIGDSLMEQLPARLLSADTVNFGLGGDTTRTLYARMAVLRSIESSRMVILEIGVNDLKYRPVDRIALDYATVLSRLPPAKPLVMVSVLPVNEAGDAARHRRYLRNDTIRTLNERLARLCAARPGCRYLDVWPAMLDPGGTQPRTALYGPDGWHLSAAGNAVLADAIRPALVAP